MEKGMYGRFGRVEAVAVFVGDTVYRVDQGFVVGVVIVGGRACPGRERATAV